MSKIYLRSIFTPQAVAAIFKTLPPVKSTVIDKVFPTAKTHPLPVIGVSEIEKITGTIPVVRRGGNPIPLQSGSASSVLYAPVPIMPSVDILASELNDLQVILGNQASRDAWVASKVDDMRRIVRNTTEAIASVVMTTGKYSWALKLDGGAKETFEIDFGTPNTFSCTPISDSTKLSEVYDILSGMAETIENNGYGENIRFFAGMKAFGKLINIAQGWCAAGSANPISIKLENNTVNIGGYIIERMAEKYQNPLDSGMVSKVGENDLIAYGDVSGAGIYYCAIDSISANNKALPFHVYTEQIGDSAIRLQAQSKPVPVRPPKSVCKAQLVG